MTSISGAPRILVMNYFFFVFVGCFLSFNAFAELEGTIQTGRPGQAIGAGTPGVGVFQIQSGFEYQTLDLGAGSQLTNETWNNVIRLGLDERFEVRAVVNHSRLLLEGPGGNSDSDGWSAFRAGFRYVVLPAGLEWLPQFAIQTQFETRAVSSEFRNEKVLPSFLFAAVKPLCERMTLIVNYGMNYNGVDPDPIYNYVFSLGTSFSERWGSVLEVYGNEADDIKATYYGLGFSYLMNSNFQWDLYGSTGENRGITDTYLAAGISWRVGIF